MRLHVRLLIGVVPLALLLMAASAPRLTPGTELPPLEVKSLSGDVVALPRDTRGGHPTLLVIGFSKAATKLTQPWLDACRAAAANDPAGSGLYCYDVRMLESVPRLFRSAVERSMRTGFPVALQRQTLLAYTENDAWRERVGADDDKTAYLIGCDRDGRVRRTARGTFMEAELKKLLDEMNATPGKKP